LVRVNALFLLCLFCSWLLGSLLPLFCVISLAWLLLLLCLDLLGSLCCPG
jgi:hypothetical protein